MTADPVKLSPARFRGLEVVVHWATHFTPGLGATPDFPSVSNVTDLERATVYWQTADWLATRGLVEVTLEEGRTYLSLTDLGREVAATYGLTEATNQEEEPVSPAKSTTKGKAADKAAEPAPDNGAAGVQDALDVAEIDRPAGAWAGAIALSIEPDRLEPDPDNVRADVGDVSELAASLAAQGVLVPVIAIPLGDFDPKDPDPKGRYRIVSGHRRVRAAAAAGLDKVPVLVRPDLSSARGAVIAQVVENVQRADLAVMDEARAFKRLRDLGLTQKDIAGRTGLNQGTVSKRLALLDLPDDVARKVDAGTIPVADAVDLTKLPAAERDKAARDLVSHGVRPAAAVKRHDRERSEAKVRDAAVAALEKAKVAVVDYPARGHWPADREDQPLTVADPDVPSGQRQAGVAWSDPDRRVLVASIDAHAGEPCHGAAVADYLTPDGAAIVIYVCLDPARHGIPTPDELEARERAERDAAEAEREAVRQEAVAAADQRRRAVAQLTGGKVDRRVMADHVAVLVLAAMTADYGETPFPVLVDDVDASRALLGVFGVDVPDTEAVDIAGWQSVLGDLEAIVAAEGPVRVAFVAGLLYVEGLLTRGSAAHLVDGDRAAAAAHLRLLVDQTGYQPTDGEAAVLAPPEPLWVPTPPPDEVAPDGAVAWYAGSPDPADEARWVDDDEAAGIGAAHPDRLTWLAPSDVDAGDGSSPEDQGGEPDNTDGPSDATVPAYLSPAGGKCAGAGAPPLPDGRCRDCGLADAPVVRGGKVKAHKAEPAPVA